MRLLLVILLAILSAAAVPFLLVEARPDALPGSGEVGQAWEDAVEIMRVVVANARREAGEPEIEASGPVFEEQQALRTAAVVGSAVLWASVFTLGGILALVLLGSRSPAVLIGVGVVLLLAYSCTRASVSFGGAAETERWLRAAYGLGLAGWVAGFLAAWAVRRATL